MADTFNFKNYIKIGIPIFLYTVIGFMFSLVDSIMIAPLGSEYLGAIGQAGIFFSVVLIFFQGILAIFIPVISKVLHSDHSSEVHNLFRNTIIMAIIMSLPVFIITSFADNILLLFNQPQSIVKLEGEYLNVLKWSAVFALVYSCFVQFFNLFEKTKHIIISIVLSNIVNIIFNYLLIYGNFYFPRLGIEGSAVATNIARVFSILYFIVIYHKVFHEKLFNVKQMKVEPQFLLFFITKGVPKGINYVNEWFASFILVLFVGLGGVTSIVANQVGDIISSFIYMVPQTIATIIVITCSKVFHENPERLEQFKKQIFKYNFVVIGLTLVIVTFGLKYLISLFSLEYNSEAFNLAQSILYVHLIFFVFYSLQYMFMSLLDVFLDTKWPSIVSIIVSYFFVIPVAYLTIKSTNNPIYLWIVDGIGNVILCSVYYLRYKYLVRKNITITNIVDVEKA